MKKLLKLISWEIRIQNQYKIYLSAVIVTVVWAVLLFSFNNSDKQILIPFVIFVDLAIIGFYFMGAMILFEKGEKTIYAMICTPLKRVTYFIGKLFIFSMLSVAVSFLLIILTYKLNQVNIPYLICGVVCNALLYTMFGFIAIAPYQTITQYLVPSWLYLFLSQLPLLTYFHLLPDKPWLRILFLIHPTQGTLNLISAAFQNTNRINILYSFLSFGIWFIIFTHIMCLRFQKYIIEN